MDRSISDKSGGSLPRLSALLLTDPADIRLVDCLVVRELDGSVAAVCVSRGAGHVTRPGPLRPTAEEEVNIRDFT